MKQADAERFLKSRGFEVDGIDFIWYKSDRVGGMSGALITLADYIPSMIDADYKAVDKTVININGEDPLERLEDQINRLLDTPRRWEEHLRESRVKRVKEYFKEHKLMLQRFDELISKLERGEHLSREEQRELSVMCHTV